MILIQTNLEKTVIMDSIILGINSTPPLLLSMTVLWPLAQKSDQFSLQHLFCKKIYLRWNLSYLCHVALLDF